ncbi:26S proteasome non-ATPase regulatory subunit 12-like [Raphidocelis subcapitata]|uniref:26S proteasome non-ATPase regulatory subunit 12-like n=1 Tax=Raphidocelis subcapitata TaxID=307507 RepID=A0A2V0P4U3_9CHLO|nr:26S proteasome non-ATPase regulatory subunit 12-like [Raphidocelis subcapitata]|eukprot:GBF93932.1 26S proteasome non-ATPase regulatory subunit 12-like [Raphidocelis subcapitata]
MVVGEFTVSNIAMEEDAREEEKKKGVSTLDLDKFKADVAAQEALAKKGKLHEALEGLLNLEKTARQAEDIAALRAACSAVLAACYSAKEWKLLEENIVLLSKRRGQLRQVIQSFVRQAMGYIDSTPDKATKVSLIKTLQTVTEGKIFVEIERARLTRRLATIQEADGQIQEAADTMQEVPVETFGAMAKSEKIAFILEQVRLCLAKQDYMRAQILARKISPKAFVIRTGEAKGEIGIEGTAIEEAEEGVPSLPELKIKYYQLMIQYHMHSNNYLEVCRAYRSLYESEGITEHADKWTPVLKKICWFAVLTPTYSTAEGSSSDIATLIAATAADKRLADALPLYKQLLDTFQTSEIVRWPLFEATYGAEMTAAPDVFGAAAEGGPKRRADLQLRVVEHNVLTVAKYYTRISMARLAELLDLTQDKAEEAVSKLAVSKAVTVKIDRPAGVVAIGKKPAPEDVLNAWASNIGKLLGLVDKATQMISKESMVHKVPLGV